MADALVKLIQKPGKKWNHLQLSCYKTAKIKYIKNYTIIMILYPFLEKSNVAGRYLLYPP